MRRQLRKVVIILSTEDGMEDIMIERFERKGNRWRSVSGPIWDSIDLVLFAAKTFITSWRS